jgi:uncharacterized membrane-anchored protein
MSRLPSRVVLVAAACAAQLALVGVAVAGPLSARLTGEEYLLAVRPVDPVDPFRGAYVDLGYPTLTGSAETGFFRPDEVPGERGEVFVALARDGELWRGGEATRTRPASGPYLRCSDAEWRLRCGIESWFLPQDKAIAVERAVASGTAVARVRVDGRGNAALVGVEVTPAG